MNADQKTLINYALGVIGIAALLTVVYAVVSVLK